MQVPYCASWVVYQVNVAPFSGQGVALSKGCIPCGIQG
jgi:hypothetical protein